MSEYFVIHGEVHLHVQPHNLAKTIADSDLSAQVKLLRYYLREMLPLLKTGIGEKEFSALVRDIWGQEEIEALTILLSCAKEGMNGHSQSELNTGTDSKVEP